MTASDRAILSAKWNALGGLRYTRNLKYQRDIRTKKYFDKTEEANM